MNYHLKYIYMFSHATKRKINVIFARGILLMDRGLSEGRYATGFGRVRQRLYPVNLSSRCDDISVSKGSIFFYCRICVSVYNSKTRKLISSLDIHVVSVTQQRLR